MLALLVDWGYRDDGIPVRLFGAWTTLPAGPATLAAKTGATILPIADPAPAQRPLPGRARRADHRAVERPRPTSRRRPQAIADALERIIGAAPDQWYSFKPMWPATAGRGRRAGAPRRRAAWPADLK